MRLNQKISRAQATSYKHHEEKRSTVQETEHLNICRTSALDQLQLFADWFLLVFIIAAVHQHRLDWLIKGFCSDSYALPDATVRTAGKCSRTFLVKLFTSSCLPVNQQRSASCARKKTEVDRVLSPMMTGSISPCLIIKTDGL